MTYSSTGLIALAVHCIVNYDALRNRQYDNNIAPAGKTYRWLVLSVAAFYIFDALWGVLYEAKLISAVFADTVLYFVAMAATVFLWTRYVIHYLQEKNWLITVLYSIGWVFLAFIGGALILNFFIPVMFRFDENGVYHAENLRYIILTMQIILFLLSAFYVLITAKGKDRRIRSRHWAIGTFGIAMTIMVILQTFYPLLPMYSIGCLLGTSILHTFVLEDLKEARRLELEEMLRREVAHKQELGSAKQLAYRDSLTGVKSYNAYVEEEQKVDERIAGGELKEFGVVVFDVNGLKLVNDTKGHEAGDCLLQSACRLICTRFKHSPVFRIGGDEFVALLEGEDYQNREALLAEFEKEAEMNLRNGSPVVASGLAVLQPGNDTSYRSIFERADTRMYDRKRELKAMDS